MIIEKNKVVTFHYRLSEAGGDVVEDSREHSPAVYLHGHPGMIRGLTEALEGKQAGDSLTVTLPPEDAYGPRLDDARQRVSINHVISPSAKKTRYKPGMLVHLSTDQGPQPAVVLKVGLKSLDVDTNHPLAGKTLTFHVEVVDVRDASEEEIAHGHVHGEGGHQH